MRNVIAIANPKGGVGKTSLTANIAVHATNLLHAGRVLAVDLDERGDLAIELGYTSASDNGQALADTLGFGVAAPLRPLRDVRPGLDVVAGGHLLALPAATKWRLGSDEGLALTRALGPLAADYALMIIDCPPGGGPMTRVALAAAEGAVVPVRADDASLAAINTLAALWRDVTANLNPDLSLLGIAVTQLPAELPRLADDIRADLAAGADGALAVFDTTISSAPVVAYHARRWGRTVAEYADDPDSVGLTEPALQLAEDYRDLTAEILRRLEATRRRAAGT